MLGSHRLCPQPLLSPAGCTSCYLAQSPKQSHRTDQKSKTLVVLQRLFLGYLEALQKEKEERRDSREGKGERER